MSFELEPYDPLAKTRAVLENGRPVAWVDYDDVVTREAHWIANVIVNALNKNPLPPEDPRVAAARDVMGALYNDNRTNQAGIIEDLLEYVDEVTAS